MVKMGFNLSYSLLLLSLIAETHGQQCSNVYPHLSCGVELHESESNCIASGCCWDTDSSALTRCFAPAIYGYKFTPSSSTGNPGVQEGSLHLNAASGVKLGGSADYEELKLELTQETPSRTHLKIYPVDDPDRWEVPETLLSREGGVYTGEEALTESHIISQPDGDDFDSMMLLLSRTDHKTKNDVIFTLSKMLVFQDQYLQMVLGTPANTVATFGFGESSRLTQKLEVDTTYTLWNTDDPASNFNNTLYGSHPFFVQVSDSGQAHGVLFLNSNAMDVTLSSSDTQGDTIGIQATGGIIDMYIFAGPTPEDVVQQYLASLDIFPAMVPRWSLGFHNCRWGYETIQEVEEVVTNYSKAELPLEVQWLDIDYMDRYLDFTIDPVNFPQSGMDKFIDRLHSNGQYFVPIIDPAISTREQPGTYSAYDEGLAQNIFVRDLQGVEPYLGQVWPGPAYFPDFFADNATSYWQQQLEGFYKIAKYDGIWIDMNEASNFCNYGGGAQVCELRDKAACNWNVCCLKCETLDRSNKYDFPPFVPHTMMKTMGGRTMPMSARMNNGILNYNAHNLYGFMESIATNKAVAAIKQERPFVLSRSTYVGSGKYTAHWTGDNAATWDDLKVSIVTMNNMAVFGIPMIGADICGFQGDTTEELCARWIEVGAFSPFSRDHNIRKTAPQELYRWDSVTAAASNVLNLRYRLLPHLYTLMYRAHTEGRTVHNAMWMHFPKDLNTFTQDGQYMWSDGLLFTPVLTPQTVSVRGYFPAGLWFSLFDDAIISSSGEFVDLDTPLLATNAHVRGGVIVPMQDFGMTTAEVTASPYTLLVALCENKKASGGLFVDDGKQLNLDVMSEMTYKAMAVDGEQGKLSRVLLSEVVKQTNPNSGEAKLRTIEVLEATTDEAISIKHCEGYIQESSTDAKLFANDVIVSNFDGFSRLTFSFQNMDMIKNFEFHWECE